MTKKKSFGFTLIELLVVVAVIGLLASIVMAALNDARTKGGDAGVKSNMRNAISQGEVFYNTNTASVNSYTSVCTNGIVGGANGIGLQILTAARVTGLSSYATNAIGSASTATCNDSATAWAAEAPMKTTGKMWCVDSTGKSVQTTGSTLANATDYSCN